MGCGLRRFWFAGLVLLAVLAAGCAKKKPEETEKLFCGSLYVFERQYLYGHDQVPVSGDTFSLSLLDDGTFSYYETLISSYIGFGKWTCEDASITLTEEDGRTNILAADGNDLVWQAEGSDNFRMIKARDGERFHLVYEYHPTMPE